MKKGSYVAAVVFLVFSPVFRFPFLNWDDEELFVRNTAWHAPHFVRWAFTTTFMQHVQPLAWMTWRGVDFLFGLTPTAAHTLNVVLHAVCAAMVFVLARRVYDSGADVWAAVVAALLFALHPLRVEVVAWASAMPYALALLLALMSTLAFIEARTRPRWLWASIALYALSLLARPIAIGLPVVLVALDWYLDSPHVVRSAEASRYVQASRYIVFFALAVAAAYLESRARIAATLSDVGIGARMTLAVSSPFKYLFKTIVPLNLTPLDPLALTPQGNLWIFLAGSVGLFFVSWVAWRWRETYPGILVAWVSYLALLVPAIGLVPSGLQATADRYAYLPAVPVAIWIAAVVVPGVPAYSGVPRAWRYSLVVRGAAIAVLVAATVLTFQQMQYWRDSVALWTRAVEIDPQSDVALYNLASALARTGLRRESIERYDEVLRLLPDQADARRNRDLLRAAELEQLANGLAASGDLDAAIAQYRAAIALDSARTHSQAALGMALAQTGRPAEALPHLREAVRLGAADPAIANALAFSLVETGGTSEACRVLEAAREKFPEDVNVARNLKQLQGACGR